MVAGAVGVALLKLPPTAAQTLTPDLEEAAQREVSITLLTASPVSARGVEVALATYSMDQIVAVVDGRQVLAGIFSDTGSADAIWTQNPMLAQLHHAGLSAEVALANVASLLAADEKRSRILKAVEARRPIP